MIELMWGAQIGYPTEFISSGGSHYLGWGLLHCIFGALVMVAHHFRWDILQVEWTLMTWVLSLSMMTLPLFASFSSIFGVFPELYVDGGHSNVLLIGGIMQGLFIIAMAVAIHGPATQARNIS
ncbi:hypothetical protein CS022_20775 [Veronia nyctiphanis]|uniref:Uncharacterized protein n=1 Tax=Veronia nyctiphanis TaxID=1278244 RepID=A0A4Q0YNJ8_9GAMM|nr:hypothetical protein [Veronia nyctiphanis]RXJ71524.1 hypothetical protein CS022_20775 [Veronia nyctiphanis]